MMTSETLPTRILGPTGFPVTEIAFGAWAIGAEWGEKVPSETARGALHAAIDAGMRFIDTADIYGGGRSECLIGEVLKERSERIFVATKMGKAQGWEAEESIMEATILGSIERLGVDVIDLVQLHCIPPDTLKAGKVFEHLEMLKAKGLIRYYGASVESIDEGLFCLENSDCASLQVIFNIFRQRLNETLLPKAKSSGVGIIARVPLASGVLAGKFTTEHEFDERDHRRFNANGEQFNVGETFAGVPFAKAVEFAERVRQILADEGGYATLAQKSLRWILDHDTVSTVIPGAKSAQQARDNAAASALPPLSNEAHEALKELYRNEIDAEVRGVY